jgi:hypothetical protein
MRAVASIPAYVERSTRFFAVVPTVKHADLEGVECDLGSWLERGWVCAAPIEELPHKPLLLISHVRVLARLL